MGRYYRCSTDEREYYLKLANRPLPATKASKYRGVTATKSPKYPFRAALTYKGKRYYLGQYKTEEEAAQAYNKVALKVIGEYAVLNKLPEPAVF